MKRLLFSILGVMLSIFVFAQGSNLIIFSEQGEQFWVVLNGIKQNDQAETNVKITSLIAPSYKLKIIFKDLVKGELDKTIYLQQESSEDTYVIKKNNKNVYIMRFMNTVPIAQAPQQNPNQQVLVYSNTPPPEQSNNGVSLNVNVNDQNIQNNNGVSVGVNINDQNLGANFNMNVNTGTNQSQSNINYSTTSTYSSNYYHSTPGQQQYVYQMPGYNGPIGCPYPMPSEQFIQVKQSISSKSFDDTKLTLAKQVINTNCLLSSQVKEILLLFSFEDTRLDLAKYAYGYTYDVSNYYTINDAFTFESSIDDLNKYITSHPVQPIVIQPVQNNNPHHSNQTPSSHHIGCSNPIANQDFVALKQKITSKPIESARVALAKQYMNKNCFSVEQVKQLLMLLSADRYKMELAKFAIDYTWDLENYYMLSDVFDMGSNIDEFNNFVQSNSILNSSSSNNHVEQNNHPAQVQQNVYVLPGYNGPLGCQFPMSHGDFINAKQSISSKSFEDSKLTLANQILNSNCLLTSQVKEIMLLFSFEDTRLKLAKSAYGRTYDIGNYYLLNDAFTFESSIDELNKYISGYKK